MSHVDRPDPPWSSRWKMVRPLKQIGFQALTYIVEDKSSGEPGVMKVMRDEGILPLEKRQRQARFDREREALKRLVGEDLTHLVKIRDLGVEGDQRYYVMDYYSGGHVMPHHLCNWTLEKKLNFFRQICEGVSHLHERGIVHRDLYYNNVLIENDDAYVADFGLCYLESESQRPALRITQPAEEVGPDSVFMAPECAALDSDPTPASDVYSLGKMLFWILSNGVRLPRELFDHPNYDIRLQFPDLQVLRLFYVGSEDAPCFFERLLNFEPDRRLESGRDVLRRFDELLRTNDVVDLLRLEDFRGVKRTLAALYPRLPRTEKEQLGRGERITLEDVAKTTRLEFHNENISDISPLAVFQNLEYLNLNQTKVANLQPLRGLTNLRRLYLLAAPVRELPFERLQQLDDLSLGSTTVPGIVALRELPALRKLHLPHTGITDFGNLSSLTSLEVLNLRGTKIKDLRPLSALKELRTLILANTDATDVRPLAECSKLENLRLDRTRVQELTPLSSHNLELLSLSDCANLSGVLDCTTLARLRHLDLRGCQGITDVLITSESPLELLDLRGTSVPRDRCIQLDTEFDQALVMYDEAARAPGPQVHCVSVSLPSIKELDSFYSAIGWPVQIPNDRCSIAISTPTDLVLKLSEQPSRSAPGRIRLQLGDIDGEVAAEICKQASLAGSTLVEEDGWYGFQSPEGVTWLVGSRNKSQGAVGLPPDPEIA